MLLVFGLEQSDEWSCKSIYTEYQRGSVTAVVESHANAICCDNHPELGKCLTGIDDDPVTGSCSIYCKAGGCKGAICKELKGMDPECHCLR
ncbi:hypothetical protein J1N35_000520 [Gossypium stocksii]|uniref:Uncharacterized protein n=1 Tax=Gossypium stocksii TaxID=47602 RepID=A0A9D3WH81_9ROSI|nr:hypothetical protein J1N35_000520 [Gossypium stocksii]